MDINIETKNDYYKQVLQNPVFAYLPPDFGKIGYSGMSAITHNIDFFFMILYPDFSDSRPDFNIRGAQVIEHTSTDWSSSAESPVTIEPLDYESSCADECSSWDGEEPEISWQDSNIPEVLLNEQTSTDCSSSAEASFNIESPDYESSWAEDCSSLDREETEISFIKPKRKITTVSSSAFTQSKPR
jgi:hypothetical protein